MNEIAVIEQLPIITEKIKGIGEKLDKRLEELHLDNLICTEETKKEIKNLRTSLGNELKEFETQRKNIKAKIILPYEEFNKIYEEQIKNKYQNADLILSNKINEVESQIRYNTEVKMREFFEEYKHSKAVIEDDYLSFADLDIKNGINLLTEKGELKKSVKDEIKLKVDSVEQDINTINSMEYSNEILVEYLKTKNISLAIKEVNDRHMILDAIEESNRKIETRQEQEEQVVTQVEEVLQAPIEEDVIDGQMSINDFEEEEIFEASFTVKGTKTQLRNLKEFLDAEGIDYE